MDYLSIANGGWAASFQLIVVRPWKASVSGTSRLQLFGTDGQRVAASEIGLVHGAACLGKDAGLGGSDMKPLKLIESASGAASAMPTRQR
jgi:hypothetical protein